MSETIAPCAIDVDMADSSALIDALRAAIEKQITSAIPDIFSSQIQALLHGFISVLTRDIHGMAATNVTNGGTQIQGTTDPVLGPSSLAENAAQQVFGRPGIFVPLTPIISILSPQDTSIPGRNMQVTNALETGKKIILPGGGRAGVTRGTY